MSGTTDRVATYLAEQQATEQAATKGPWVLETDWCDCGDGYGCSHGEFAYAFRLPEPHTEREPGEKHGDYDYTYSEVAEFSLTDARFIETARSAFPSLLAALEAVLAAHRPTSGGDGKDRCCWCRDYHGERSLWPCGEYLTIKAKLLGPETAPAGEGPDHA